MTDPLRPGHLGPDDHRDRSWMPAALCRGLPPAERDRLFFPGQAGNSRFLAEAKAMCRGCPVVLRCAEYGMEEHFGVWGGMSERQRKRLRPAWRRRQDRGAA